MTVINPDEISSILKESIRNYEAKAEVSNVGISGIVMTEKEIKAEFDYFDRNRRNEHRNLGAERFLQKWICAQFCA